MILCTISKSLNLVATYLLMSQPFKYLHQLQSTDTIVKALFFSLSIFQLIQTSECPAFRKSGVDLGEFKIFIICTCVLLTKFY